jgi:DNA-directed RNA polymerase subunit RPC12/RpoP
MVDGYEITFITCRACGRKVERAEIGNELVGCHERMRCTGCGHRGADLHRVWHVGKRPANVVPMKKPGTKPG